MSNAPTDRTEQVLNILKTHIPASAMERHGGRALLITKGGIGIDVGKLAAALVDLIDEDKAEPTPVDDLIKQLRATPE